MIDPTELRRLAEAATPGPWTVYMGDRVCSYDVYDIAICEDASLMDDDDELTSIQCDSNAAYIAAMHPQTTLALLDRLARAETLAADARRFQWLLDNASVTRPIPNEQGGYTIAGRIFFETTTGPTIRAAIDAEMKEKGDA